MSLWLVGRLSCLDCGYADRRAVDLLEIATTPTRCPACQSRAVDYQFNFFHWDRVTDRLSLGGRIPNREAMRELSEAGVTHVLSAAPEADDTELAAEFGIRFLLNGCPDDEEHKPADFLGRSVQFVLEALDDPRARVHVHCAAGARRSVMVMLAVLGAQGMPLGEAIRLLAEKRAAAQFVPAYVESVENFLRLRAGSARSATGI